MARIFFVWVVWIQVWLLAGVVELKRWSSDTRFESYLLREGAKKEIFRKLSSEDRIYLQNALADTPYIEMRDSEGVLLHALIPIGKALQAHVFRDGNRTLQMEIVPIRYRQREYYGEITIQKGVLDDTKEQLGSPRLAKVLKRALNGAIDTKTLQVGDKVAFLYVCDTCLGGAVFENPKIKIVWIKQKGKERWVYVDQKGIGHTSTTIKKRFVRKQRKKVSYKKTVVQKGKNTRFLFPLRRVRITSHFSHRRWHPILRRYRPHYGTDFGAKRGTPLRAVHDGVVSFAGWKGGYGKVVQIKHKKGYESLYAHQSRIKVKRGQRVKRGQIIGYVGSTGRSTGPHLHFGMKKNGRWINPLRVLGKVSIPRKVEKKLTRYVTVKKVDYKKVPIPKAKKWKQKLQTYLKDEMQPKVWDPRRLLRVSAEDGSYDKTI